MGNDKNILFDDEELKELEDADKHKEIVELLRQLIEASKDETQLSGLVKSIQNNAVQLSRFVEVLRNIKIEAPSVTVEPGSVNVEVKNDEVVAALGGMFSKMEAVLSEVKKSNEQLAKDVKTLNETYKADRIFNVHYDYNRVESITVSIKK